MKDLNSTEFKLLATLFKKQQRADTERMLSRKEEKAVTEIYNRVYDRKEKQYNKIMLYVLSTIVVNMVIDKIINDEVQF